MASLAEARHSLAETTLTNLDQLNSKLEQTVSSPPKYDKLRAASEKDQEGAIQSETSSDSDPAELFHVDMATQTTPRISRSGSISQLASASEDDGPETKIDLQESQLQGLQDDITYIKRISESASSAEQSLATTLQDLQSYLKTLQHEGSYQRKNPLYASYLGPTSSSRGSGRSSTGREEEDEVENVRTEIRGIKSILLNAKNFPTGQPVASGVGRREVR